MAVPKYPPYINAYGKISKLLTKIKEASVPPKVTRDFLSTVLGLKSSSYHATIPFLKRLGFLDQGGVPTQRYKDFRSDSKSGFVMAKAVKEAYVDIYQNNEYAHQLDKKGLVDVVATVTGAAKDDAAVVALVGTFLELIKFATFDVSDIPEEMGDTEDEEVGNENKDFGTEYRGKGNVKLGISYTINLNLPATTEIKVFDAIFKSLKKNLLDNRSLQ
ncbi:DUF5343 domain-containing protein [Patescibacteria group bacterium]